MKKTFYHWTTTPMAPPAGFEPATLELTALCSTTELRRIMWEWRDLNPQCRKGTDLQSAEQPLLNTPKLHDRRDSNPQHWFWRPVWYHFTTDAVGGSWRTRTLTKTSVVFRAIHYTKEPNVTPEGFEPPLSGPKPLVLPLYERVI